MRALRFLFDPRADVALLSIALSTSLGCYDSRWGQAKRAQQRAAVETKPAEIATGSFERPTDDGKKVLRVRMRPNGSYLAQTIDAPK